MRLSDATLAQALPGVAKPAYDRSAVEIGVVHFGPGAFHRAHQAFYFDELLATDPRWGVCVVSLKSPGVRDALRPQDGLYTLAQLDAQTSFRVIGAIKEVLVAPEEPQAVLDRLAAPLTNVVTLTVTEKGYCLGLGGALDFEHPDIRHDLENPRRPVSAVGWLAEGLRLRREAGLAPYTVISCDNLPGNGRLLGSAVAAFARRQDEGLASWIEARARFPSTMVDSITPATTDALKARVGQVSGLEDAWPIQREAFVQWVVEDVLAAGAPDLASVGVTLTSDVEAFEQAKLRLLNGPHSSLAYMGLARGHETVGEAMADPELAGFVRTLMVEDIAPTVHAPGLDAAAYIDAILSRFRNPEIRHLLSQIAWDGSQKLPIRLLGTVRDALEAGRPVDRLARPIAAWMQFVVRRAREGAALTDPMAEELAEVGRACTGGKQDVDRFLALSRIFPAELARAPAFRDALIAAY